MVRHDDIVVLTEKGRPVFAIVGLKDDLALEALALSRNSRFLSYLDRISRGAKRERTCSLDEMRKEFLHDRPKKSKKRGPSRGRSGKSVS
jgi:antitoxin (DNA-binding transcriptional repressor) of toxin-antitoxin stability system